MPLLAIPERPSFVPATTVRTVTTSTKGVKKGAENGR